MAQSHHQSFRQSISQRGAEKLIEGGYIYESIGDLEKQLTGCVFNEDYVKQLYTHKGLKL